MKIDNYLITKQDIENIKIKEKIDNEINKLLQIEYDNLIYNQSEKYQIDYNNLNTSEHNKYILKKEYNFYDGWQLFFISGIVTELPWGLMSYVILFKGGAFEFNWFYVFLIMLGIALILYGRNGFIVRRKIKKNFKELGINI